MQPYRGIWYNGGMSNNIEWANTIFNKKPKQPKTIEEAAIMLDNALTKQPLRAFLSSTQRDRLEKIVIHTKRNINNFLRV